MKKIILSFALFSVSALSVLAQTEVSTVNNARVPLKEQSTEMVKGGHRMAKVGLEKAFEGITLSDEQKAKLSAITIAPSKDIVKIKEAKKENEGEKKEKLTPEQMRQMREERATMQQEARRNYLVQVKEILTPDQYIIFLENSYTLQDEGGKNAMMNRGGVEKGFMKIDPKKGPHKMKGPRDNKAEKE